MEYTFGNNQDDPIVGLFDPPVAPALPTPTPTVMATLSLITGLYQDVLGRTPSAELTQYWSTPVANGLPYDQAIAIIENSTEAKIRLVTQDYEQYLDRAPGRGGPGGLGERLEFRLAAAGCGRGHPSSQEYINLHGGTTTGFVQGLYQDLLARSAGASEVNLWTALAATSPAAVVRDIVGSVEYQSDLVEYFVPGLPWPLRRLG